MSEKALRDYAIQRTQDGRWGCLFCSWYSRDDSREFTHSPDCLLAADPDAVVLLREIEERLIAVDSWLRKNCNLASHDGYVGMQNALDSLQDYIQEQFHVRLTDDGWEYVEQD